ncbi:ectonucleotide pyrophosphatase/phosphodiesterase [Sphingobacterium sp. UGAL515B_05]|uniref:ectonucleotide pyrophosphatase/phosphodiesterase n=1 Tax=Sphingobacterium sp. UGAL515B_05 TaxID=2986767 RepID=UPI002954825B|nr:ectonucleotide pyrophosphatase/phosphodiesterase [Sphingobacterium sp. UGAL515B_05]WON93674.1 ectonucleotide pyrophosphatase/phosphodiesterase [Sphingobacterium sp. UGAL515B_05]
MMKINLFMLLFLLTCTNLNAQRIVVIALDGFSTEGFKGSKHPNLDKLFDKGLITLSSRPVIPSVTLPNWTSHLTGQGPEEHGITANNWTLSKHPLKAIEIDTDGFSPSIFKLLKDKKPNAKTAFYYNWAELINPINQKYLDEVSFEEDDKYKNNYAKALKFIGENKNGPTLVFLYSVHVDHAGHGYGWMSPEYIAAIEEVDVEIGKFVQKLKDQNLYDDTYFLLLSDHGGIAKGHGGVSMNEMQIPFGITGKKIKNLGMTDAFFNSNRNTSWILAKIFGIKDLPKSWTGIAPTEMFK